MRVAMFCHSLLSDWNHGNAHFLRGVVLDLQARGHDVCVFERRDAWSVMNLVGDYGEMALQMARAAFPTIAPVRYDASRLDLDRALDGCALALVHEWNDPGLVRRIGEHRKRTGRYRLLFHDTHRSATRPEEIGRFDLSGYDGVLASGEAVRQVYLSRGWTRRAWTWHEAADVRTFYPRSRQSNGPCGDVVWFGNWGDEQRSRELSEFLLEPVKSLGLRLAMYGVRYSAAAKQALAAAGATYQGWLPNYRVPAALARRAFTVHVPRRAYVHQLPGIPTIGPFEALACGAALASAPWNDAEGLFSPGEDYLVARDGAEMRAHMRALAADQGLRRALGEHGRATVMARHTCAHRVEQLLAIAADLGVAGAGLR